MAMIECAECGRPISSDAVSCPNCGKPRKPGHASSTAARKTSPVTGCLAIFFAFVFLGAILRSCFVENTKPTPKASDNSPIPDLGAKVEFDGTQIELTNLDAFDWSNCILEINPHAFTSGFKYRMTAIQLHSTIRIGALQFANGDGVRFNPFQYKPTSVSVRCDTPAGRRDFYGSWQ